MLSLGEAAEVADHRAVGQHRLDADHLRAGHRRGSTTRMPPALVRDGAADRRAVAGREVDAVLPAGRAHVPVQVGEDDAGAGRRPGRRASSTGSSRVSRRVDSTTVGAPSARGPSRRPARCCRPAGAPAPRARRTTARPRPRPRRCRPAAPRRGRARRTAATSRRRTGATTSGSVSTCAAPTTRQAPRSGLRSRPHPAARRGTAALRAVRGSPTVASRHGRRVPRTRARGVGYLRNLL